MQTLISFLLSIGLLISFSSLADVAEIGVNKTFAIGLISNKPKKRIKGTTPLLNYVVDQLPEYHNGKIFVGDNVNEMAELLENGKVSMVLTTFYAALLIEHQGNAKIKALRWKQGFGSYHSVLFTRKDSDIHGIKDLLGHTIAFEKYSSSSAFFMPSLYLLNKGFKLQKMRSLKDKPEPDKIGYFFMSDFLQESNEMNMSTWVFHRRFDAAAFSNLDWNDSNSTPINAKEKLNVIAETSPFPIGVILTSPTLGESEEQALLNVFFDAEHYPEGIAAMAHFKETNRFISIPESTRNLLNKARQQLLAHPEIYK